MFSAAVIDLARAWDTSFRVCRDSSFSSRRRARRSTRQRQRRHLLPRHGDSATATRRRARRSPRGRRALLQAPPPASGRRAPAACTRPAPAATPASRCSARRRDSGPLVLDAAARGPRSGHRVRPGAAPVSASEPRTAPPGRRSRQSPERRPVHRALLQDTRGGLRGSARRILRRSRAGAASSVLDVGCGIGTWASIGWSTAQRSHGVDGDWVALEALRRADLFVSHDLHAARSRPRLRPGACLEVAERLPPGAADTLLSPLALTRPPCCLGGDPFQGGDATSTSNGRVTRSVASRTGLGVHDVIRPAIWTDPPSSRGTPRTRCCYRASGPPRLAWTRSRRHRPTSCIRGHTIRHARPALNRRAAPPRLRTDSRQRQPPGRGSGGGADDLGAHRRS